MPHTETMMPSHRGPPTRTRIMLLGTWNAAYVMKKSDDPCNRRSCVRMSRTCNSCAAKQSAQGSDNRSRPAHVVHETTRLSHLRRLSHGRNLRVAHTERYTTRTKLQPQGHVVTDSRCYDVSCGCCGSMLRHGAGLSRHSLREGRTSP